MVVRIIPWNPDKTAGGLQRRGLAVGVAASSGYGAAGAGTDAGGSIRIPARVLGQIVGLKPFLWRDSPIGRQARSVTLAHAGPMTWTVEDAAFD